MKNKLCNLLILAFLLGSYRGYLALFDPGNTEPRQIYPCKIESLPEADRIALEAGIRVRNTERLNALLEDYLS